MWFGVKNGTNRFSTSPSPHKINIVIFALPFDFIFYNYIYDIFTMHEQTTNYLGHTVLFCRK